MDSFGDYLYIIVIILALVTSLFGKKKKVKQTPASVPIPEMEEKTVQKTETEQPIAVKRSHLDKKTEEVTNFFQESLQPQDDVKIHHRRSSKAESEIQEEENILDLQNLDEIKKAIVYTEILNRKY